MFDAIEAIPLELRLTFLMILGSSLLAYVGTEYWVWQKKAHRSKVRYMAEKAKEASRHKHMIRKWAEPCCCENDSGRVIDNLDYIQETLDR